MPDLILVLGGTTEGRELAASLGRSVYSLAGRLADPLVPPGTVRIGGFGGVPGLIAWLTDHRPRAVVDATHPFAARMSAHAVEACASAGVPLLRLQRPGWVEQPGDRWHRVPSLAAAAKTLPLLGSRVLLTIGRQEVAAFAGLDLLFVVRAVEAPAPPLPARTITVLGRPPWTLEQDRTLLREHAIDVLVTKDSGGRTAGKLVAAREAGVPVVVVDRPAVTGSGPEVPTVAAALDWLQRL